MALQYLKSNISDLSVVVIKKSSGGAGPTSIGDKPLHTTGLRIFRPDGAVLSKTLSTGSRWSPVATFSCPAGAREVESEWLRVEWRLPIGDHR